MKSLNQSTMKMVLGLTVLIAASAAMAAGPVYVEIEGINGESTHAEHRDWIEAESFNQGVSNPSSTASGTGGRTSGSPVFQPLTLIKRLDLSSPALLLATARGDTFPVVIHVLRDASDKDPYLTIVLEDARIVSLQQAGAFDSGEYLEEVQIEFSQIEISYRAVDASGQPGDTATATWDVAANRE